MTLDDALVRAAEEFPRRLPLRRGWESDTEFVVCSHNPDLPADLRDDEEDMQLLRVPKSGGPVTAGTYVMLRPILQGMRVFTR